IAENGDFRLKQVLMRGQNTKNSRDSVADLSLSVYFLFIRAVFRGALMPIRPGKNIYAYLKAIPF
ncbi:MAG: hypothetical protein Q8Q40_02900, partial [Methylococcaceae bacterium]|nr:hypothetical protein [Methylococcaceae bacterium]